MALQCHVPSRLEAVPPSHYIRIPYCHPIMTWPRATTSPHIPGSVPPTRHVQALFYTLPTRSVLIILILAKLSKRKRQHRRIYLQWSRIGLAHIFKQPFPKLNPPPPPQHFTVFSYIITSIHISMKWHPSASIGPVQGWCFSKVLIITSEAIGTGRPCSLGRVGQDFTEQAKHTQANQRGFAIKGEPLLFYTWICILYCAWAEDVGVWGC